MPTIKQMVRDALIPALAAPAVAEAGDINTGITLLKRSVVGYLNTRHPAPKEVIAPYLGKSVRWLYRMMEPPEPVDEEAQADRLQKLIFLQLRRESPEYIPISELHAYLRRCRLRYPRSILEDLLAFYVSLGFLEQSSEDPTLYRATERLTQTATRPFKDRKSALEQRAQAIYPMADAYLREAPGSMLELLEAEVSVDKLDAVADDLRKAVEDVLAKHQRDAKGSKAATTTFHTYVMGGDISDA